MRVIVVNSDNISAVISNRRSLTVFQIPTDIRHIIRIHVHTGCRHNNTFWDERIGIISYFYLPVLIKDDYKTWIFNKFILGFIY